MSDSSSRVVQWVRGAIRQGGGWCRRIASESRTAAVLDALASSFRAAPIQALSLGGMAAAVGNTAVFVYGRGDEVTTYGMQWRLLLFLLASLGRSCDVTWREFIRTSRFMNAIMNADDR